MYQSARTGAILTLTLLAYCSVFSRADDAPKDADTDLNGEWRSISYASHDVKDGDGNTVLIIDGDKLTVQKARNPDNKTKATFKVDTDKTPHTIDMFPHEGPEKGQVCLGIYEVKGDELRLCHGAPGVDRPTEFAPGKRVSVMVFKRVKK